MSNNQTAKDASDATITYATDDVASVNYPVVKLAAGTEDSAVRIGHLEDAVASSGDAGIMALAVRANTAAATGANGDYVPLLVDTAGQLWVNVGTFTAGETHLGSIGGHTTVLRPTITVDTGIYAALDVLGALVVSGVITLTGAMRVSGGSGILQSLIVYDDDNEKNPISFLFFDSAPASGTYVGNGALALSAGDKAKYLGRVDIAAADYFTVGGDAVASIKNIGLAVKASGSADLYMIPVVASGTPTYTASTDLKLSIGFLQD